MSGERCYAARAPQEGPPLIQHGILVFQAHHVGWIITGIFTIIATVTSGWLVNKHLQWYTNKRQQRYIVRLLFMVPIYSIISFASYLFWNHSTPLLLIRDGYESTVLTAFFYLLLTYLSPYPDEQKSIFLKVGLSRHADREARNKGEPERKWMFPLGFVKWKPEDGLYFLQLMKWGVLQYCVIRPITTLMAVSLDYAGLYCESSWQLRWGHIYITAIVSISVTIAMYCLIQIYVPLSQHLAPRKPLLKLFAIKAVVFLTFWQATFLSLLSTFKVVKDTKYMTANDINIGIGALLETFEMMIFAFLHIRAFTYKPYRPPYYPSWRSPPPTPTPRLRSLGHAMDFRETLREIWTGCVYVVDRMRGREPTPDKGARRVAYLEHVFGRTRPMYGQPENAKRTLRGLGMKDKDGRVVPLEVEVVRRVDVDVEGERQWLGLGDDYAYGGYVRRQKSDGLLEQIERELQRRGYDSEAPGRGPITTPPDHNDNHPVAGPSRQRSWWRTIYRRISHDLEATRLSPAPSRRKSRRRVRDLNDQKSLLAETDYTFEDPPPPSIIRTYRSQRQSSRQKQRQGREVQLRSVLETSADAPTIHHRDPPPPVPRLPSPPLGSVFGHIFPDQPGSSTEPGHNSAPSILSSFADGHTPSQTLAVRSTPRASFLLATPLVLSQVQESGVARYEHDIEMDTVDLPSVMSAQILGSPLAYSPPLDSQDTSPGPPPARNPHDRDPRPISTPQTNQLHQISRPEPAPTSTSRPPRLRRASAITSNPSTRPRRQSLPVLPRPPPVFTSSTPTPTTSHASNRAPASRSAHRTSAPFESIPRRSIPFPSSSHSRTSHQNRYSVDGGDRNWGLGSPSGGVRAGQLREDGVLRRGLVMPQPLERPPGIPPPSQRKPLWVTRPARASGAARPPAMDGSGPQRPRP